MGGVSRLHLAVNAIHVCSFPPYSLFLLSLLLYSFFPFTSLLLPSLLLYSYKQITVKQSKNEYSKVGIRDNCITFAVYKCRYKTLLIK